MIRKASIDDIGAIRALAEVAFPATYRDILSAEQLEYMMEWMYSEESLRRQMLERGDVFLLEEGRGYASYRPDGICECQDGIHACRGGACGVPRYHLEKLYVLPEWQGMGLGRRLFDAVVREVRDSASAGIPGSVFPVPVRLELNVNRNNPAVTFYEHIGMRRDRSGDFPIGNGYYMNDYIMAIDL